MESPYWKEMEVQPDFKNWLEFYDGCVHCACDHGCNQWIDEQSARTSILMKIMSNPSSTTSLDKVVKMPLKEINAIWYRLAEWRSEKFNRELRENNGKFL